MLTRQLGEITHVAFDFDGTLGDTVGTHEEARRQSFADMAAQYEDTRFATIAPEIHQAAHRHGSHPQQIIGWILQEAGIVTDQSDARVAATVARKRQIYDELASMGLEQVEGMVDLALYTAETMGGAVSIVTTASIREVMPFIQRHGLDEVFTYGKNIISAEDVGPGHLKPDPFAYTLALDRFGLAAHPERMVAIEDSPRGIEAARRAGNQVIAITTTHTVADFAAMPDAYRPHKVVSSASEIKRIITLQPLMRTASRR